MSFQNYKTANLAKWRLLAWISASATSMMLETDQGDLFPDEFPYFLKIEKYDSTSTLENKPATKREIVKVTNKALDTFTIVRSAGNCPESDTATSQTDTAFSFDSGDYVFLVNTAEDDKDIKTEIARLETDKLNISDYISGSKLYAESSTWTDAYAITLSDISSLTNWMRVYFEVDVANTGSATLNVSSTGVKDLVLFGWDPLQTWYISAGQIVEAAYDEWNDYWEVLSVVDQSATTTVSKFTQDVVLWEDITAWDWKWLVFFGVQRTENAIWTETYPLWSSTSFEVYKNKIKIINWILKKYVIDITKQGTPTDDITVTFNNIDNTSKTLTIANSLLVWEIDIAGLYHNTYWEFLIAKWWYIGFELSRWDTPNITNHFLLKTNNSEELFNSWSLPWIIKTINVDSINKWYYTYSFVSRGTYTNTQSSVVIKVNWEAFVNASASGNVGTLFSWTLWLIEEWDIITIQTYANDGNKVFLSNASFIIYNNSYSIEDWLDSDKVWNYNPRYDWIKKMSWVIIESWVALEKRTMVKSGWLVQTNVSVWDNYYMKAPIEILDEISVNSTEWVEIINISGIDITPTSFSFDLRVTSWWWVTGYAQIFKNWNLIWGVQTVTGTVFINKIILDTTPIIPTDIITVELRNSHSGYPTLMQNFKLNFELGKWEFTNTLPPTSLPFLIWRWTKTNEIELMINEQNFKWLWIPTSITPWSSPYLYKNETIWDIRVHISWWTVSNVSLVVIWIEYGTGRTSWIFTLKTGESLKTTYSVVPTMKLLY